MKSTWTLTLLLALVPVTGCSFYVGGDDDDDCPEWRAIAPEELRNPETGACEAFGGGWDDCGPYPAEDVAWPDWGYCYSECTGLDENTCQDTPGCRAIYVGSCSEGDDCGAIGAYEFAECWDTAQSGPIQGGDCSGLDAHECSRHDDCVARHYPLPCPPNADCARRRPPAGFESCAPEATSPEGSCHEPALCRAEPPECPAGTVPGVAHGCWTGYCIPEDECEPPPSCEQIGDEIGCVDRADCAPIYEGVDCTCDGNGNCTCADWIFQACETGTAARFVVP